MICKICGKKLDKLRNLSIHLNSHNINLLNYYIKYEGLTIQKCIVCGKDAKHLNGIKFRKTCGRKECKLFLSKNRRHSKKVKKIISEKRKEYLKNNPDKHVWKNKDKFRSVPCEYFKKSLRKKGISFVSEYTPLDNRLYSIDISFPNKKIGIEINGNQHYNNDKTLKKYYKNRKNDIEKGGWILYDIHYSKVYDNYFVDNFINHLKGKYKLKKNDFDFYMDDKEKKCIDCGVKILKKSVRCKKCASVENGKKRRKVYRPSSKTLLKCVKEFGYRGTGKKYGVSDNSIRKWLKK